MPVQLKKPWIDEVINLNVELVGGFVDLYKKHKPKGMSDQNFVNAIISSWLMEKDT